MRSKKSYNKLYPNGANFHDAILGNVKSRNNYQVFCIQLGLRRTQVTN